MAAGNIIYPPVGFHFKVEFGLSGVQENDAFFQEVSGMNAELEVIPRKEGGENRFVHTLPVRTKFSDITLKRGLLQDSRVLEWCKSAVESLDIQPIEVWITLLNENHEPLQTLHLINAWPKKWSVSDFNAGQSQLVIETLVLAYQYFVIVN